ncbi:MAG: PD40 domain-containing protein [Polyangiaceae bacterium]|nr:PD40 domain-containing protein [Polyangiaceae bacterium]
MVAAVAWLGACARAEDSTPSTEPAGGAPLAGGVATAGGAGKGGSEAQTGGSGTGLPSGSGGVTGTGGAGLAGVAVTEAGAAGVLVGEAPETVAGQGGETAGPGGAGAAAPCSPGSIEVAPCGRCGTRERLCWGDGSYLDWSPCQGELESPECRIDAVAAEVPCFRCTTASVGCDTSSCRYVSDGCYYLAGEGWCDPGTYVVRQGTCPNGQFAATTCGDDCHPAEEVACVSEPSVPSVKVVYESTADLEGETVLSFVDWDHAIPPLAGQRALAGNTGLGDTSWSSNGDYLVFKSRLDHRLYVLDFSRGLSVGGTAYAVFAESDRTEAFAWAPDRSRLAFTNFSGRSGIWLAEVSGPFTSNEEVTQEIAGAQLTDGRASWLAWSPDGAWLAARNGDELVAMDVAVFDAGTPAPVQSTGITDLGSAKRPCVWSPVGADVLCLTESGLKHAHLGGVAATVSRVASELTIETLDDVGWLGDGSGLILRGATSGTTQLFLLDLTAGSPALSGPLNAPLPRGAEVGVFRTRGQNVFFEADGAVWMIEVSRDADPASVPMRLFGDPLGLDRGVASRWRVTVPPGLWDLSADGRYLACGANALRPEVIELFGFEVSTAIAASGNGARPMLLANITDQGELAELLFAPDSVHLAFLSKTSALSDTDPAALWVVALEGARAHKPQKILDQLEVRPGGEAAFGFRPGR